MWFDRIRNIAHEHYMEILKMYIKIYIRILVTKSKAKVLWTVKVNKHDNLPTYTTGSKNYITLQDYKGLLLVINALDKV